MRPNECIDRGRWQWKYICVGLGWARNAFTRGKSASFSNSPVFPSKFELGRSNFFRQQLIHNKKHARIALDFVVIYLVWLPIRECNKPAQCYTRLLYAGSLQPTQISLHL